MAEKIFLTGAAGFIGRRLVDLLIKNKYHVIVLTRNPRPDPHIQYVKWDGKTLTGWEKHLENTSAVINLAGENIGSGRWTASKKEKIRNSRVNAGKILCKALENTKQKPKIFIQASAIGIYSPGFLSGVVKEWEASTKSVETMGIRRVIVRIGMVLGTTGGAFPRLRLPFRFFVGGPIGNGKQWMSWIHIDDVASAVMFLMKRNDLEGVFDLTTPYPIQNKEFARTLGKIMKRPWFFPVPAFILKTIYGQMAQEVILSDQEVFPRRLLEAGFAFRYPKLKGALEHLVYSS